MDLELEAKQWMKERQLSSITATDYQARACETAIFPKKQAMEYLTLGLTGESGEIANKVKKFIRDGAVKDEYLARAALMQLVGRLKETNEVTALFTGTIPEASEALSGGGIVEYIVDSVMKLDFVPVAEEFKRTLTIRKMRRTDHSTFIHPFDITKDGLKLIDLR